MIINNLNISLFFIYFFIQVFIAPKNDYSLISTINTLLTASISNYLLITDYHNFIDIYKYDINEVSSLYQYPSKFIASYVLYDIYYSLFPFKKDMIIHGILLLSSIILIEYYNIHHVFCQAFLIQTSTLFLNYIRKSDICGLLFVLTFFVYRIVIFPILSYRYFKYVIYVKNNEIDYNYLILMLLSGINILNFYWFNKIIKKFKNKLLKNE